MKVFMRRAWQVGVGEEKGRGSGKASMIKTCHCRRQSSMPGVSSGAPFPSLFIIFIACLHIFLTHYCLFSFIFSSLLLSMPVLREEKAQNRIYYYHLLIIIKYDYISLLDIYIIFSSVFIILYHFLIILAIITYYCIFCFTEEIYMYFPSLFSIFFIINRVFSFCHIFFSLSSLFFILPFSATHILLITIIIIAASV